MGLPRSNDGKARFLAYVEGLTSVIGHADRAKPLRDYCLGLMMPCERKSVEPMAAITAPERTAAQHQSLLHFIGEGDGRTRRFSRRCGNWCCQSWNVTDRSKRGSSTTRAFPRKAAFGRGGSTILRRAWQAGQLSGRGDIVDRQSRCELAGSLSAVLAKGMGE